MSVSECMYLCVCVFECTCDLPDLFGQSTFLLLVHLSTFSPPIIRLNLHTALEEREHESHT